MTRAPAMQRELDHDSARYPAQSGRSQGGRVTDRQGRKPARALPGAMENHSRGSLRRRPKPARHVANRCRPEQVNEAKRRFEQDKRSRLSRLEADSAVVKAGMEDQKDVRDAALSQAKTLEEQEKELAAKLAATEAPAAQVVEDLPDYVARAAELRASIQGAEERIRQLETDCASRVQELKTSIMAAENTLSELRGEIAPKGYHTGRRNAH